MSNINPIGACKVCKRRHDNIGYQQSRSHPLKWFCRECFSIRAATLSKKQFDIYESDAMMAGGTAAGQYLDSIGQTDLAELNEMQFRLFFAKFLGGYEDSMKRAFERTDNG